MTTMKDFTQGIERIKSDERYIDTDYMADMSHWCAVHATKYMPKHHEDGTMYIPTTAMATDFDIPRSTVHVTLNHVVTSHTGGNWHDMPIVVLAPYNDVTERNGNPAEVSGTDTYWSLNPDAGLILPESTYIVHPTNDGPLYQIGEHGATYKRDNYTEEEVALIESWLSPYDLEKYTNYKNGDLQPWAIQNDFYADKRVKQMYESAKDKRAFLRGLFEESRFDILSQYLRDMVVRMSMEKMGKQWIGDIYDCSARSEIIANTAEAVGLQGTPSNKGHSNSIYAEIEQCWWHSVETVFRENSSGDIPGILTTTAETLYDVIVKRGPNGIISNVISNILENKPMDFMKVYEDRFRGYVGHRIGTIKRALICNEQELQKYKTNDYYLLTETEKNKYIKMYQDNISKYRKDIEKMSAIQTIDDYDKNLAKTIRAHCTKMSGEYNAWRNKLEKEPGFEKLVEQLRSLVASRAMQHSGRDNL